MAFPRRLPLWYGACVRAQKRNGIRHFELSNSPLRETPVKQYQTLTSEKYYADNSAGHLRRLCLRSLHDAICAQLYWLHASQWHSVIL